MAPSYSPQTGWFYFMYYDACDMFYLAPPVYIEGKAYWGSMARGLDEEKRWGVLKAIDPASGEEKWSFRFFRPSSGGTMATSGGLIFTGDEDGYVLAFDAKSGKNLWRLNTGNRIATAPVTFLVDGRQFVTVPSGAVLITFALPK